MLIQAEHPKFGTAVESDLREVHVAGTTVNPVLHIAMHEIVTNRLLASGEPPPQAVLDRSQRLMPASTA